MENVRQKTIDILKAKSLLKQDVYKNTLQLYGQFQSFIEDEMERYRKRINDERVRLKFDRNGDFETQAYVGSDVLVFNMHSNVFTFPPTHRIWNDSYLQENPTKSYCGIINIYNFLADSFLQNRMNDAGYLIGRIFINKDSHFAIEGRGELGYIFSNIRTNIFNEEMMRKIFCVSVRYAANFDLFTPPYENVGIVNVQQIKAATTHIELQTGKRMGFKFQAEEDTKY